MAADSPGYRGNSVAIQCGAGGLAANLNPSKILLKNVIVAEGAVMRQDHWRKEPGTALFGTITPATGDPADALIVALSDWHPTEQVQRLVCLRGDGFLYFTANGGTNPGAFKSTNNSGTGTRFGLFVTGGSESAIYNRKLFLFRANKMPTYVNGDVTDDTNIDRPAVDWSDAHPPITGLINGGRLWAAGNTNNPHQLYASTALGAAAPPAGGPQTDFTTVGGFVTDFQTLSIFPGVGERIVALRNYQGFIVVFKYPRGIFLQDARDSDPSNWLTQQITDVVGCAPTPYAALQLENDVLFFGSDGQFYLLSAVIAAATGQQNMETANIGMDLEIYQFLLNAYNRSAFGQIQSVYFPFWQTAMFTVPGPSAAQNNTRLLFDFNAVGRKQGEPRFSYSYRDLAASLALRRDPGDFIDKPIFGDYSSNVILMEQDARETWNGAAYPFRVQTPHTNLAELESIAYVHIAELANRNKLLDNLEIEYVPNTSATITIRVYIDAVLKQTITTPLILGGAPLDSFILDTDTLAEANVLSVVQRLNPGAGRRFSIAIENLTNGEDVAITHLYIGFRQGDTTQVPRR